MRIEADRRLGGTYHKSGRPAATDAERFVALVMELAAVTSPDLAAPLFDNRAARRLRAAVDRRRTGAPVKRWKSKTPSLPYGRRVHQPCVLDPAVLRRRAA